MPCQLQSPGDKQSMELSLLQQNTLVHPSYRELGHSFIHRENSGKNYVQDSREGRCDDAVAPGTGSHVSL